jgi:hypothetical protein
MSTGTRGYVCFPFGGGAPAAGVLAHSDTWR